MPGQEDGVRIDVCIEVKKGINMYAVDTAGGAAAHSRGFVNPLLKNIKMTQGTFPAALLRNKLIPSLRGQG